MILENKFVIKIVAIFFLLTFALVTGKDPKIFILTFVPTTDTQCQLWAISIFSN